MAKLVTKFNHKDFRFPGSHTVQYSNKTRHSSLILGNIFYQTARNYITQDGKVRSLQCEKLKYATEHPHLKVKLYKKMILK